MKDRDNIEAELRSLVVRWIKHDKDRPEFSQWQERRLWQEKFQQDKLRLIKPLLKPDSQVLDLGCGMGGTLVALVLDNVRVVGMDMNSDYCRISRFRGLRYKREVKVVNGMAETLPLKDQSVDLVLAFDVLEHVNDPALVLAEAYRILKPDGVTLVTVINRYGFYDQHFHLPFINWLPRFIGVRIVGRLSSKNTSHFSDRQTLNSMHYFSYSQFERLAARIGFKTIDINQEKINHPEQISDHKKQWMIKELKKIKILPLGYWFYSRLITNQYIFQLYKERV